MKLVEALGSFYLGKILDPHKGKSEDLLLYKSSNLTTHAVCVGMTGSGKTGLGIDLIEEAALNQIPAIIIDPKGDLGNLLLTFPELSAKEFLPWIDESEAARKGLSPAMYAEQMAHTWQEGLSKWGESTERIKDLRNSVDMVIYTPASNAGVPISILSSFAAPSKEMMQDEEAVQNRVMSITASLLGLLGINADPVKSREFILISTIINHAWNTGSNLDILTLIQQVQRPPFDKIGALDTDTFFPPKDRLALSISLNNLIASPGFQAWMKGEPLNIQQLLFTQTGKPKLAVISIAHLSNAERMFFVTILLNEIISWMRRQPGTSNLRALLYMDEIFGFFPPVSMPPSKLPMLTLLKQARAFGIGVVLATQNPVDLDYKGLANCGTWFIGKLQTERDKSRVIEGLQTASNGDIDAKTFDKMLALTGNRIFIMRSIYEKAPILFETRWTLSYLRGPLTLAQISLLTQKRPHVPTSQEIASSRDKPIISSGILELFGHHAEDTGPVHYRPLVMGAGKLHFTDAKNNIDVWKDICLLAPASEGDNIDWSQGFEIKQKLDKTADPGSSFDKLPSCLMNEKKYESFQKSLFTYLYQNQTLTLYHATELKLTSQPGQTLEEFRTSIAGPLQEKREQAIKKVQAEYADKMAQLQEKIKRMQEKMATKQQKAIWQKVDTGMSFFASLIDIIFGRKLTKGAISKAGSTLRRAGKVTQESQEVENAEAACKNYQEQLEDLQIHLNSEIARISASLNPQDVVLEPIVIRPKKSDIALERIALVWWPS